MSIFQRIRNLWRLSAIEAPKDSQHKKNWTERYVEKLSKGHLATIIEMDKPNMFKA